MGGNQYSLLWTFCEDHRYFTYFRSYTLFARKGGLIALPFFGNCASISRFSVTSNFRAHFPNLRPTLVRTATRGQIVATSEPSSDMPRLVRATAVFALCGLALGSEPALPAHWPGGNDACRCMSIFDNATSGALVLGNNLPNQSRPSCELARSGNGLCYPAEYGSSGCQRHDYHVTPECSNQGNGRPAWCKAQWCYVDPSNCQRRQGESDYFRDATWNGAPLTYSYETCGYVDNFDLLSSIHKEASAQPQGKLRIAFPSDSGEGYALVGSKMNADGSYKVQPGKGVGGTNRSGSVMVFMDELLDAIDVEWREVPISARSREFSPTSSWTACVYEVALGNADMCWANFWVTNQRRGLTAFTGELYIEPFYLIVRKGTEPSVVEYLLRPFQPFTPALWVTMFVLLAYVGVTLAYESGETEGLWEFVTGGHLFKSIFKGMHAFTQGEVDVENRTSGSWLTQFFVGFTVLVMTTGYTALVTTQLVQESNNRVTSMDHAIDLGMSFCAQDIIHADLHARFPKLRSSQLVPTYQGARPDLDRMDDGDCDAAIMSDGYWFASRLGDAHGESRHCTTKERLAQTVATFTIAMPVNDAIARGLSWRFDTQKRTGRYVELEQEAMGNYTQHACGARPQGSEAIRFGVMEMAGMMLLLLISSTASLIITRVGRRMERETQRLKLALDTDGDGQVSRKELVRACASHWLNSTRRLHPQRDDATAGISTVQATPSTIGVVGRGT